MMGLLFLYLYMFINAVALVLYTQLWLSYLECPTANVVCELYNSLKPIRKPWRYIILSLSIALLLPAIIVWYIAVIPIMTLIFIIRIALIK